MSEPACKQSGSATFAYSSRNACRDRAHDAVAGAVIIGAALGGLHFFYSRGLTNIYGDAIAHMEGARRLTDSLAPGYAEIGSVWLPLFHVLVGPLAMNDHLWRTGLGGSLVSEAAFAVSGWFLFRLATKMNGTRAAGWLALTGFVLAPNMLYAASTPLTEPLAIMWAVLMVYELFCFQQLQRWGPLVLASVAAFLGSWTRYDGWFLLPFAALFVLWVSRGTWTVRFRRAVVFSVISAAGPLLWVAHNAWRFGNPLEFYKGPYSARAIYAHQLATTGFRYPTDGSLLLSTRYYIEDLKLVIGVWPLELAVLGVVAWIADRRRRGRRSAALLFLVPLAFYVESMAHAGVPIYVPTLFPHTYYNLRYGLEMLPAMSLWPTFLLSAELPFWARWAMLPVLVAIVLFQDISMARRGASELVVAKEAILNTPCRSKDEQSIIQYLRAHFDGQVILMAAGKYPCVMPQVGIDYRRTLTEMNRQYWNRLQVNASPWVGWVIRGEGDPVDELMRAYPRAFNDFVRVADFHFAGEEAVQIYRREIGSE